MERRWEHDPWVFMLDLIIPSHHNDYLAFRAQQQLLVPNPANAVALAPVHRSLLWYSYNPTQRKKKKKACRAGQSLSCFRWAALIC